MPLIDMSETYQMTNVGAHIDGTDVYQSNDNLLDNAYFVGGGSQLGDGVFPINQRGQASYSWTGATCIDRWYIFAATDTVTLSASGLTVNANENGGALGQRIRYYPEYSSQPLTCTFLTTDNKRIVWSFTINTGIAWQGGTLVLNEYPDFYVDALYDSGSNTIAFVLAKSFDNVPHSITLKAAKLEIGTVSTLPNDSPPDFGEELRKCQRYLWVEVFNTNAIIANGASVSASDVMLLLPTPVSMRPISPIVTFTVSPAFIGNGTLLAANYAGAGIYDNNINLYFTGSVTAFSNYSLLATSQTTMTISCEL